MTRDPVLAEAFMRRLTITRIAKRLGISTAAVAQWRRVPSKHVEAVAEELGIPAAQLRPDLFPSADAPSQSAEAA